MYVGVLLVNTSNVVFWKWQGDQYEILKLLF